jgi:hypothetical protein
MDGRAFLDVARELLQGASEAHRRAAAGRAYYALLLEGQAALERWGVLPSARDTIHYFVRIRFVYAPDPDLKKVAQALEQLGRLRNQADYALRAPGPFGDAVAATEAVAKATTSLTWLDQVDADPSRRAAAVAGIRTVFP